MNPVLSPKMKLKTKNILTALILIAIAASIYAYAVMQALNQ